MLILPLLCWLQSSLSCSFLRLYDYLWSYRMLRLDIWLVFDPRSVVWRKQVRIGPLYGYLDACLPNLEFLVGGHTCGFYWQMPLIPHPRYRMCWKIKDYRTAESLGHHLVTAILSYFAIFPFVPYYCLFFIGPCLYCADFCGGLFIQCVA